MNSKTELIDGLYHAKLSPSSAHRWLNCPYSVQFEKELSAKGVTLVDETSKAAATGTAAHTVLENCIESNGVLAPQEFKGKKYKIADHTIAVNQEMIDKVTSCIEFVNEKSKELGGIKPTAEQWVRLPPNPVDGLEGGTTDITIIDNDFGEAHILDLKYGRHAVEVNDNPQLMLYAIGVLNENPVLDHVTIYIMQPLASHPSGPFRASKTYSRAELLEWWYTTVIPAGILANSEVTKLEPNPSQGTCFWCMCKTQCSAFSSGALADAKADFGFENGDSDNQAYAFLPLSSTPISGLPTAQLAHVWKKRKHVELTLDIVEQELEKRITQEPKNGLYYGVKRVHKNTNRRLTENALDELALYLDDSEIYTTKLKSMTELLKILKQNLNKEDYEDVLSDIVEKPIGEIELTDEKDNRQNIDIVSLEFKD